VVESYIVDAVEPFGLEKEMSNLPRPHRYDPSEKTRRNWLERHEAVADQEAQCTEKMQTLGYAALVVETVVVPALLP